MTIVSQQYAAELVTSKGKVYMFDAIECMIRYEIENSSTKMALKLINCYDQPGQLINAANCEFLISKKMPSPMGEYLTGFSSKKEADKMLKINGGEMYTWNKLLKYFENN